MDFHIHIGLDEPASYIIKFQGRLAASLGDWFQGDYSQDTEADEGGNTVTTLNGIIADQAALHGLLRHIRDLGLALLYVDCVSARESTFLPQEAHFSEDEE